MQFYLSVSGECFHVLRQSISEVSQAMSNVHEALADLGLHCLLKVTETVWRRYL